MMSGDSAFINCPFDEGYQPIHNAIVLATVACGFTPRSALETESAAIPRMQRIGSALRGSRYSIHDLTRAYGEPHNSNLARFNMPFEFGMAFQYSLLTADQTETHEWLALLPAEHPHGEFISDLSGYDLRLHHGTAPSVVAPVMAWLSTRETAPALPSDVNPQSVCSLLPEFFDLVAAEDLRWGGHLPWMRKVAVARELIAAQMT